ncbi:MAG: CoA-binding protein [Vicinamibacteria bacterium]|nr:CoA-binding protein [Vicinamibacteria bacterium]
MTRSLPANPGDEQLKNLLQRVRRIAVVGLSPKPHRDSHRVSAYMQRAGYEIIPVYPREDRILGARVFRTVSEAEPPVDLINVFRRSEDLPEVVDDILRAAHPDAPVWFQLDCVHEGAIADLARAGRTVIYDRCLMVEHARLAPGG